MTVGKIEICASQSGDYFCTVHVHALMPISVEICCVLNQEGK